MVGIKTLVGDVVDLSHTNSAFVGDLDLERGLVLETDEANHTVKVVFFKDGQDDERFFDLDAIEVNVSKNKVINIDRDYKIMDIIDTTDTATGQPVSIITMAKMNKTITNTGMGYLVSNHVNEFDTDVFICLGLEFEDPSEYIGTVKRISFANFKVSAAEIDGVKKTAFYTLAQIFEFEEIFSL